MTNKTGKFRVLCTGLLAISLCSCTEPAVTPGSPGLTPEEYARTVLDVSSGNEASIRTALMAREIEDSPERMIQWADRWALTGNAEGYFIAANARESFAQTKNIDDPDRLMLLYDAQKLYKTAEKMDPKVYQLTEAQNNQLENGMRESELAIKRKFNLR